MHGGDGTSLQSGNTDEDVLLNTEGGDSGSVDNAVKVEAVVGVRIAKLGGVSITSQPYFLY